MHTFIKHRGDMSAIRDHTKGGVSDHSVDVKGRGKGFVYHEGTPFTARATQTVTSGGVRTGRQAGTETAGHELSHLRCTST